MGGDLDVASVPGAGSAFVLVLPGPTDDRCVGAVGVARRTLADEEVGLEERAVLRAIAAGRPRTTSDADGAAAGRGGTGRLRALPSLPPRTSTPAT